MNRESTGPTYRRMDHRREAPVLSDKWDTCLLRMAIHFNVTYTKELLKSGILLIGSTPQPRQNPASQFSDL